MDTLVIFILVLSGLVVGFINTLAGGGTIISLSLLMLMGLPPVVANGTNRLAVLFQVLTSSASFRQKHVLDVRKGTMLGIPAVIGSLLGTWIAIDVREQVFEQAVALAMIFMLFFIFAKPSVWLKGRESVASKKTGPLQYVIFFFIGIYGGFIHVGVGYLILAAVVLGAGMDLVRANAMKVYIVLLYIPFSLAVFIFSGQVNYKYGLVHAVGNIAGAWMASRFAVAWGASFVRWVLLVVVLVFSANTFGLIDLSGFLGRVLAR